MTNASPVFKETYHHYLEKIAGVDFSAVAPVLGGEAVGGGLRIPFFGKPVTVTVDGMTDEDGERASFDACIVLFKAILMCPDAVPEAGPWTAYREFRDAAPLVHYFAANAEMAVAKAFAGRLDELGRAVRVLGGRPPEESLAYDAAAVFDTLPRVPMLMLFNDSEDGFEASCSILFRRSGEAYLDMECVGILGAQLAAGLKRSAGI